MSVSHFYLNLDTTAPTVDIDAPKYAFQGGIDGISIKSDERLSSFQDIYAIDSEGQKHEFVFKLSEDKQKYIGTISFNEFPFGEATVYIRISDEVGNTTDVHKINLNVISSLIGNTLTATIDIKSFTSTVSRGVLEPESYISSGNLHTTVQEPQIETYIKTMGISTTKN